MIIRNVNLETVCGITSPLPENHLPEIAFAGKSNVGKSSLINGLDEPQGAAPGSRPRRGRHRPLIFITSMRNSTWWICPDTGTPKSRNRRSGNGAS